MLCAADNPPETDALIDTDALEQLQMEWCLKTFHYTGHASAMWDVSAETGRTDLITSQVDQLFIQCRHDIVHKDSSGQDRLTSMTPPPRKDPARLHSPF